MKSLIWLTLSLTITSMLIPSLLWAQSAIPSENQPASPPASQPASPPASQPASQPASPPASPPASQPASQPMDDIAELEQALQADTNDAARKTPPQTPLVSGLGSARQSMNPDISIITDLALAFFSTDDALMSGGHDPTSNGFTLQQVELAVSAMVDPYFRFDANIVFSQFGVEIEEAYATTLSLPLNLQARVGQFLTRFGRINPTHPHTWRFVDQMLVLGKFFGSEGNRALGLELSVLLPLSWYVELISSMTQASGGSTARSFFGDEDLGVEDLGDFQYTLAAKQFFPLGDNWSLMWGLSSALGPNSSGRDNRTDIFGTDIYLKYRPITHGSYTTVSLELEYQLRRRQVPLDLLQDQGLYAVLFYRFAKRWAVAARYEAVSGMEADPLDPPWSRLRQRASGNLTFWPTEFSRLRLQYNHDRPGWRAGYHAVLAAIELAVGAHGAHAF